MAGECISYGAFGPFNTVFRRNTDSYLTNAFPSRQMHKKLKESWTNFLPYVIPCTTEDPHASKPDEPYDHEEHAGLKGMLQNCLNKLHLCEQCAVQSHEKCKTENTWGIFFNFYSFPFKDKYLLVY